MSGGFEAAAPMIAASSHQNAAFLKPASGWKQKRQVSTSGQDRGEKSATPNTRFAMGWSG